MLNIFAKPLRIFRSFMAKLSDSKSKLSSSCNKKKRVVQNKLASHEFKEYFKGVLKYLMDFCFVIVLYGVMINYIVMQLLSQEFSFKLIIAWGLVGYIIKSELPDIIQKCKANVIYKK